MTSNHACGFVSFAVVRQWSLSVAMCAVCFSMLVPFVTGAERSKKGKLAPGQYNPDDGTVDLFAGMKDGTLEVEFIPKDSTQANVRIKNKSDKPLNVKLPDAFAAMPVLAQRGGLGGGGGNNMMGGGGNQGMGGGMGGMGGGGMGGMGGGGMGGMGGGGMGMFNVPAEKVGKFKVPCVCLEHGKAEPRAAVPYKIMPIEEFTTKPEVRELCSLLGYGKVVQRVAQAAAWNLANEMSWEALSSKRIEHIGAPSEPYFSTEEVQAAMSVARESAAMAAERAAHPDTAPQSPGEKNAANGEIAADALAAQSSESKAKLPAGRKSRAR